ncbi:hypothetical protein HIM_05584 [Hirsutella minnesotensis 3608]|uniref:Early meiotic induction protein 1 n=1 Tax=Hirsutella minnesotensis 3608 TaxID=1043627 RepID=A0A0F7ZUM0_9HYPO|nr:hypothetical protein HIM_05584 [Hirsutella minnesotensis 3608]
MGWLWASSLPNERPVPAQSQTSSTQDPSSSETVDPEIQKFLDFFKDDAPNKAAGPSTPAAPASEKDPSSSSSRSAIASWLSLKASASKTADAPTPHLDPFVESMLPTEMSCQQAFDYAWSCNGMGGQLRSVYRYGSMRDCSQYWDDFWFCMRTKSYTGELKENMIREHYRKKEYQKYGPGKPSSEDVWESRTEKLPHGTAFSEQVAEPTMDDEEWRRAEAQRRRDIRQGLGFKEPS